MVGWDLCLYLGCSIRLLLNETVSSVIRDLTFQCVSTQRHRCSHAMRTQLFVFLCTLDGSKHSVAAYICIFITTSCISTISIYVQSPDFTMSSLFIFYEHNRKEQVELAGSGGYLRPRLLTKKARETRSSLLRKALRRSTMHAGSSHRPSFLPFMLKKELLVVCRDSHYPHVCSLQIPV